MRRLSSIALAVTVSLALLLAVLGILNAGRPLSTWPTATYEAPDHLWASEYLPGPDFEIALECSRR